MAELGQLIFGRRQFDTCAKAVLPCQFKGQLRVYTRLMYCFFLSLVLFSTQTGACNEPRNVLRGTEICQQVVDPACREFFRGYHWIIRLGDGQTVDDWSSVGWQS